MEQNLTNGSVMKHILRFSLPYLLAYFLQTLYGMADLFIIGQFEGVAGTTAVAVGSQVMHLITVMLVGLAMGSTVLIESLFVIPGLGSVMMNGISNRDFMLVANGVLIISIFVAICNLVVDILYGIIDPRTR